MSQNNNSHLWSQFIRQLREGVKPAVGCTEPISLALAAAKATALLAEPVVGIEAWVSPNLMKNGMGVTVPGTGMAGRQGAIRMLALKYYLQHHHKLSLRLRHWLLKEK